MVQSSSTQSHHRLIHSPRLAGLATMLTGTVAARGLGSVRMLAFALLMRPEQYGALRLATIATTLLASLAGLGLYSAFVRFLPEAATAATAARFSRKIFALSISAAAAAGVVLWVLAPRWAPWLFHAAGFTPVARGIAVLVPALVVFRLCYQLGVASGAFRQAAAMEAVQNMAHLALGTALLLWLGSGTAAGARAVGGAMPVLAAYMPWAAGIALACALIIFRLPLRRLRATGSRTTLPWPAPDLAAAGHLYRRALKFSLWFAITPMFQYLFDLLDRYMLAWLSGLEVSGIYSFVAQVAGGMFFIGAVASAQVVRRASWLHGRSRTGAAHALVRAATVAAVLASVAYSVVMKLAAPLAWRIAGPAWAPGLPVLDLWLCYYTLFNGYYLFGGFAALKERAVIHALGCLLGLAVAANANLLLIPTAGMRGAAWGSLAGLAATLACHAYFAQRAGVGRVFQILLLMAGGAATCLVPAPMAAVLLAVAAGSIAAGWAAPLLGHSETRLLRYWVRAAIRHGRLWRKGAA